VLALACQYGALDKALPGVSSEYVAVPVLSIPHEDFALRQDAVYLMEQLSLTSEMLVFIPSLPDGALAKLAGESRLKVALTDHNKLAGDLKFLSPAVVAVVDHHEDTGVYSKVPYYNVVPTCGSACTLVAQLVTQLSNDALSSSAEVKALLGAAILLDTEALKGSKTSDLDVSVAASLGLVTEGTLDVTEHGAQQHKALFEKRISIAALSSAQRLRKDYKQWTHPAMTYGIATVPGSLREWTETHVDIEEVLADVAETKRLGLLLVMLTSKDANNNFQREIIIYSADHELMNKCCLYLAVSSFPFFQQVGVEPSLDLNREALNVATPLWVGARSIALQQRNIKASRKQVQPAVESFLNNKT